MSGDNSPVELAPLLRVFGSLAPTVAKLVRLNPALARRIVFAPPQAIHALAAYLQHGVVAGTADADIAATIEAQHPRALLAAAFPHAPKALYKALSHAGDRVASPDVYLKAVELAGGQFGDAFLTGNPLNHRRLQFYEALPCLDPTVVEAHRLFGEDLRTAEAVSNVAALLRAYGIAPEAAFNLPPSAGRQALYRRLMKLVDGLRAPAPAFEVPAPYRRVATVGALRDEALRFHNCLRDRWHGPTMWLGLASGDDLFVVLDEPMIIARFHRAAPGIYAVGEIVGLSNGSVPDEARQALVSACRQAGGCITDYEPSEALRSLHDRLDVAGGDGAEFDDGDWTFERDLDAA